MADVPDIGMIAREFCSRGGKRLRPALCAAAYRAASGTDGRAEDAEEAVECIHKASLVHDDIQDGDEERYGRPALWRERGVPVAMAAGDWLVAHAFRVLAGCGRARASEMVREASDAVLALCEGQADELLGRGDYVSVCERKTGSLFALAAALGALAAGADPAPYRAWGLRYGVYFQICDDMDDGERRDGLARLRGATGAWLASDPLTARLAACGFPPPSAPFP